MKSRYLACVGVMSVMRGSMWQALRSGSVDAGCERLIRRILQADVRIRQVPGPCDELCLSPRGQRDESHLRYDNQSVSSLGDCTGPPVILSKRAA